MGKIHLALLLLVSSLPVLAFGDSVLTGRVLDARSGVAVSGAVIAVQGGSVRTDAQGRFSLRSRSLALSVKAPGYLRAEVEARDAQLVMLQPFEARALYLSFWAAGSERMRKRILELVEASSLNALVIDAKGDDGQLSYRSSLAMPTEMGAQDIIPIKDLPALLQSLRQRGIYSIARIVVFRDSAMSRARPELALKTPDGALWHDRGGMSWTSPLSPEVRNYNIAVALEAAQAGFDEIHFDYMRFPAAAELGYGGAANEQTRVGAIRSFIRQAAQRLAPYNIPVSVAIFGYALWEMDDIQVGQRLEAIAGWVDYVCPMLYPSSFEFGVPGMGTPMRHPELIVSLSLEQGHRRMEGSGARLRPWLQAFRDYAFDRRNFGDREVWDQTNAADSAGSSGWMIWHPSSRYALSPEVFGELGEVPPRRPAGAP